MQKFIRKSENHEKVPVTFKCQKNLVLIDISYIHPWFENLRFIIFSSFKVQFAARIFADEYSIWVKSRLMRVTSAIVSKPCRKFSALDNPLQHPQDVYKVMLGAHGKSFPKWKSDFANFTLSSPPEI